MVLRRYPGGGISPLLVGAGGLLSPSGKPPLVADWSGPSMTMGAGTWTTEITAAPFSFTDPTFNNGRVNVIIDDGSGGKFVGGSFTSVTCNVTSTTYTTGYERLVHLLPTGEVDSAWSCPVGSGYVYALALDTANDVLYVGGSYSSIGGQTRADLAAVTASTGVVDTGWTCDTSGVVNALALDAANGVLYVGGNYTTIGGQSKADLAAVAALTGVVDAGWTCNTAGQQVSALALDTANDVLYVGGWFGSVGGAAKTHLAAVTASTGVVVSGWTCNTDAYGYVYALALDAANDVLYVGGRFLSIGGQSKITLAAVTASTGVVDAAWTCNATPYNYGVWALALDTANDVLYVGGTFSSVGGQSKTHLAAVTASTGVVDAAWTCNASHWVFALLLDTANDALFVGGDFNGATGLDGQQRDRFGTVVASTGDLHVP